MVPLNILVVLKKSLEIEGDANTAVHLMFSCVKVDGTTPQRWLQHQVTPRSSHVEELPIDEHRDKILDMFFW